MEIENRYLTIKRADIDRYLNVNDRHTIHLIAGVIERKRKEEQRGVLRGVYIDKAWPIYNHCEAVLVHWLEGGTGGRNSQLDYVRRIERELAEAKAEIARMTDILDARE